MLYIPFTSMTSTCKDHALHPLYTLCFTCALCKLLKKWNCLESPSVYLGSTNLNNFCSFFFWTRSCFCLGSKPFPQKGPLILISLPRSASLQAQAPERQDRGEIADQEPDQASVNPSPCRHCDQKPKPFQKSVDQEQKLFFVTLLICQGNLTCVHTLFHTLVH